MMGADQLFFADAHLVAQQQGQDDRHDPRHRVEESWIQIQSGGFFSSGAAAGSRASDFVVDKIATDFHYHGGHAPVSKITRRATVGQHPGLPRYNRYRAGNRGPCRSQGVGPPGSCWSQA